MAWNESGGGDKDPWGNRGDQGPPDLDEAIRKLQGQLSGLFGGGKGATGGGGGGGISAGSISLLLIVLAGLYVFSGVYQVDEQERGVVFRFGKLMDQEVTPGLHWNPPLIDQVQLVNVTQVQSHSHQASMLTKDENIVDISLTVQWVIASAADYLINVRDPKKSLDQATESALRHVAGSSTMDQVITDGREAIAIEVQERLRTYLKSYGTGIDITKVNIDRSAPPVQVQDAFNDVQKAKEDQQKFINQATAYSQQVVPEARGKAQRQLEEAQAYRDRVIARSEGEAERFEKLLNEYSLAKQVTRDRLYIDALENVFKNASKVMVDVEGGNNMMYLPLDKLTQQSGSNASDVDITALRREMEQLRRDVSSSRTNINNRNRSN
ncbi:FtsH protease activity modulator HflK [Pseudomonadales bacterium]|jgi:membrane protease subunit HflK|nr:FtsH protease activity modulator HflK [Pseudomonadales bacterium]MDA8702838.1 FtsH protease activity modulator HflK [Pseudomonadales bacterium]MDA9256551.1 FtsH protease activity modulator HflK [Pseudomonadales bacterium]MDB0050917.1 FtsH protease activity modulator HflK [Pseudomonadales bacterium]MDB2596232.1 FtsH protease activity modulator HflK [Pseudomonadales bacterium]